MARDEAEAGDYKLRTAAWGHFKMSLKFSFESFVFESMNKDFSEDSGA